MVQVYTEVLCRRHYAAAISEATVFRVFGFLVAVVLSLVVAIASRGFWVKFKPDITQATVQYSGEALLLFETGVAGSEMFWSSSSLLNTEFANEFTPANVQVGVTDLNFDGKPDVVTFKASIAGMQAVTGVKALLQFSYALEGSLRLQMYSLAYMSYSSGSPGGSLYTDGQLLFHQANPITEKRFNDLYNVKMLTTTQPAVNTAVQPSIALHLQDILKSYLDRNYTTSYSNVYNVWQAGAGSSFELEMLIRIPPAQVVFYRPQIIEMLKGAWIQFLATYAVLWWLLWYAEYFLFHYRVLSTRVSSDIQPKGQRY